MASTNPYSQTQDVYEDQFTELYVAPTDFEALDLTMSDADLDKMLINSLEADRDHWNKKPWVLDKTDVENTAYLLGDQINDKDYLKNDSRYIDNRLFSSTRAILSYATGQLAKPDITPSRGDDIYLKGARDIGSALYQHAADEKVEYKVRAAVLNLISRKRGYLKLRFDPNVGENGDIVTEVCNPEDIIIDRYAGYLGNPSKIYHRLRCSVDELCARFPEKEIAIKEAFSIRRGVYTQTSKMVTYWECWFTYAGSDGRAKEGVCWFIAEKHVILDKMPNPNWVYLKSRKKEMQANVTTMPPKPFVIFNYINTGHSYIDETCLIEQAKPQQEMLNKRGRQIWENADYVNGRWVASKKSFNQEDARNLINKGAKTVAMADGDDMNKALVNVASAPLPSYVENTLYDARNEIDQIMGTPAVFKGSQPDKQDTLGRDLMVKQQAGAMQDDLVRCISMTMEDYYKILLQMMRVYYTDDYWFQTKGGDGKYEFILINGDKLDSNVKVSVQTDSTLPLDKASIRATAMQLWQAGNAIDYKSLMEDLGLPNPDIRAERYYEGLTNPQEYLANIKSDQINNDAESDIQLLIAKKTPEERDKYDQAYFDYFNTFVASNRFQKLKGENPDATERITAFLIAVQHAMMQSLMLQESMQPPQQIDPMTGQPVQPDPNGLQSGQPLPSPQQPGATQDPSQQPQPNPAMQPAMPSSPATPPIPV
jgi:hypothetical protein